MFHPGNWSPRRLLGRTKLPLLLSAICALTALTACGSAPLPRQAPFIIRPLVYGLPTGTTRFLKLWSGDRPLMQTVPGQLAYWSPSGNHFALTLDGSHGRIAWGTLRPLRIFKVGLGMPLHVVGLTDRYVITTTRDEKHDYLFPIENSDRLGRPILWTGPTDDWEEWIPTAAGVAIETGGYAPGTLTLGLGNGTGVALDGGEMYLSTDRRFGAVLQRPRERWALIEAGAVEIQPGDNRSSIAIWQMNADGGPKRLSMLHLPLEIVPRGGQPDMILGIAFSYDDRYVAVQMMNQNYLPSKLTGVTFIYTVQGRLIGRAPYGNGFQWLPSANDIWLNTPDPPGMGDDQVVNVGGQRLASWPDALGQTVFPISPGVALAYQSHVLTARYRSNELGFIEDSRFRPVPRIPLVYAVRFTSVSPDGRGAIVESDGLTQYIWLVLFP